MTRRSTKAKIFCLFVIFSLVAVAGESALAHSTRGRTRITLNKSIIGVDDIAYFVECYVNKELYKNRFAKSEGRFFVKDFIGLKQNGARAEIRFTVLDKKENRAFDDTMVIERGDDNIWCYQSGLDGKRLEIYTYVKKWGYYYNTYVVPTCLVGIAIAACSFVVIRRMKQRKEALPEP
jgi:hypothetical protein